VTSPSEAYDVWLAEVQRQEAHEAMLRMRLARFEARNGWRVAQEGGCVGLTNIKNTCWMNAVVQSLAHVEPFIGIFLAAPEPECPAPRGGALGGQGGILTDEVAPARPAVAEPSKEITQGLTELLRQLWQERRKAIMPYRFHRCLAAKAPWVIKRALRSQQDAQEFLLFFLNALDEEGGANGCPALAPPQPSTRSPIARLFQGELESRLACTVCGHCSRRTEDFLHLSVPVREAGGPVTLEEALASEFLAEERLEGDDRWHCERCNARVVATKRVGLHRLPPVVLLHLKRFAYTQTARLTKVRTPVRFPTNGCESPGSLDLGRYVVSPEPQSAPYDMISIVNHHGRDAVAGHYTAHCQHCVDGRWYAFNDDRVNTLQGSDVWLPEEAYILCLMQRGQEARTEAACGH